MKLAEALALRAAIQTRATQLRDRIKQNALIQEGDQPAESPQALFAELDQILVELVRLITAINRTNLATLLPSSMTLTEALARRDVLQLQHSIISTIAETASTLLERYSLREIRRVATVDVGALRRQMDDLARQRRELDGAIQAVNWTAELIE